MFTTRPSQATKRQQELQLVALASTLRQTWDTIDDLIAEPHRDPRPVLQDLVEELAETLADVLAVQPVDVIPFPSTESA